MFSNKLWIYSILDIWKQRKLYNRKKKIILVRYLEGTNAVIIVFTDNSDLHLKKYIGHTVKSTFNCFRKKVLKLLSNFKGTF